MPKNVNPAEFSPHNVLGMSTKAIYLTDPMNAKPDTSDDEPLDSPESQQNTSHENTEEANSKGHDWEKRYSDLRKHSATKEANMQAQLDDLKTQLSNQTQQAPKMPKSPEEFSAFKEKYPELAAMIETAAIQANQTTSSAVTERLKKIEQDNAQLRGEKGWQELKKIHPDVDAIKDDAVFIAWFEEQPLEVQKLIQSPNIKAIAKGIDMYKAEMGIKTPKKDESAREASRAVKTGPQRVEINTGAKRTYTDAQVSKMSDKEFETLQEDIKAALYDGRYLKS